jgi:hypothetical protein
MTLTNEFRILVLDCLEREEPYVLWRVEIVEGVGNRLRCTARFANGSTHSVQTKVGDEGSESVADRLRTGLMTWHAENIAHAS